MLPQDDPCPPHRPEQERWEREQGGATGGTGAGMDTIQGQVLAIWLNKMRGRNACSLHIDVGGEHAESVIVSTRAWASVGGRVVVGSIIRLKGRRDQHGLLVGVRTIELLS